MKVQSPPLCSVTPVAFTHYDVFLSSNFFLCTVYDSSLYCTGSLCVKLRREWSCLPSGRTLRGRQDTAAVADHSPDLSYRQHLWEPRMPPVFCGIKGNDLLLIITPQSRSDSGRMSVLALPRRQQILCTDWQRRGATRGAFLSRTLSVSLLKKVVQRETSVSEVVR